ncbi:antitoxin [Flexivirga alba]|jgi:hypothetical protein|uniref:Antitoxin n=1 Tax=Flexivirga alba TaxID=702742 RepID=A0ABW2AIP0_9MICO
MVDFGSLLNKAKDFARKNPTKVRDGLTKAEDTISSKTGGKYDSQIHSAGDQVEKQLGVDPQQADKPAPDAGTQSGDTQGSN